MAKKSADGKCTFHEKTHKYKIKGRELVSVTTFLGKYFSKFDAEKMSKLKALIAKRQGIKGQGARYWKKKWKEAGEHGTRTHGLIESYLYTTFFGHMLPKAIKAEQRDIVKAQHAQEYLEKYFRRVGEPHPAPEVILYDEELGVAGQCDLVVNRNDEDTSSAIRFLDLFDYKTNDNLTTTGYKGAMALHPIQELPDCSFSKYTLQLSLYAYLLEKEGFKIGKLTILHLTEDGCKPHEIPYRKDLIEKLIEDKKKSELI